MAERARTVRAEPISGSGYEEAPTFTTEELVLLKRAVQKQKANQASGETIGRRLNELYDKLVSIQYQYDSIKRALDDFNKELMIHQNRLDMQESLISDLITRIDKLEKR